MVARRRILALLGSAATVGPSGCLFGGVVYLTVWNGGESVPRGLVAVDAAGTER